MTIKILTTLILAAVIFSSCGKLSDQQQQPANSDVTQRIFRVAASSDQEYELNILEFKSVNSVIDTVKYSDIKGSLPINQGFTPAIGDSIRVSATTTTGTNLSVTNVYKGADIGTGVPVKAGNGLSYTFGYNVTN